MKKTLLKFLCKPDQIGKYGIPAAAEPFSINKLRYLRISDIDDSGNLLDRDKKSVSAESVESFLLDEGDIVFARTGNSTGRTYFHEARNGDLVFAGFLIKFGLDENKVNPKYLKYFTISEEYKKWINNISVGSTRGNINAKTFSDCPVILPERKQQDFLVKLLSTYDEKVELSKKINKELEELANFLYDYWFLQFEFPNDRGEPYRSSGGKMVYNNILKREIPEGWGVECLENLGNFKNGINYSPSNPGDIPCPLINVRNISNSSFFINKNDLDVVYLNKEDVDNYSVDRDSILIARSGIPGATRLISDYDINTLYCGFAIKYTLFNREYNNFIFFYLKSLENQIQYGSGGTILKNVNQAFLNKLMLSLPPNCVMKKFNALIFPIFQSINNLSKQNSEVMNLRDWILPMLMNGQVKID